MIFNLISQILLSVIKCYNKVFLKLDRVTEILNEDTFNTFYHYRGKIYLYKSYENVI